MKKSVLWTAAGVVSATAIWAALSLPKIHSPQPRINISNPGTPATQSLQTITIRTSDGGLIQMMGSPKVYTFEWSGTNLTWHSTNSRGSSVRSGAPRAITLDITMQTQNQGPGFRSTSMTRYSRTLQPGETLDL